MIKINCLICGKEIKKPKVGQLLCGSKKCKKEYSRNKSMEQKWRLGQKGREWNKEYYKRPKIKKK